MRDLLRRMDILEAEIKTLRTDIDLRERSLVSIETFLSVQWPEFAVRLGKVEAGMETLKEMKTSIDKIDATTDRLSEKTWKITIMVIMLAASAGAGGFELVKQFLLGM